MPQAEEKWQRYAVTDANGVECTYRVPFIAALRYRKLARALVGKEGTTPPAFGDLQVPSFDTMCGTRTLRLPS
eukprot:3107456-Amphidinium_carterae.1